MRRRRTSGLPAEPALPVSHHAFGPSPFHCRRWLRLVRALNIWRDARKRRSQLASLPQDVRPTAGAFAAAPETVLPPLGEGVGHLLRTVAHRSRMLYMLFEPLSCSQIAADVVAEQLDAVKAATPACAFSAGPLHISAELGLLLAGDSADDHAQAMLQVAATQVDDVIVDVQVVRGSPGRHGTLGVVHGAPVATLDALRDCLKRLHGAHRRAAPLGPLVVLVLFEKGDLLSSAERESGGREGGDVRGSGHNTNPPFCFFSFTPFLGE